MLKYAFAAVGSLLVASAASAQAADVPLWAGPYVGIHGGYGFDGGDKISNQGLQANNQAAINDGRRAYSFNQNRGGALGGGQIGFNLQNGNLVYGVEGDFSYMDQRGDNARSDSYGIDGRRTRINSNLDWMGTARARVGYSLGRGLVYATGGYAFGRIKGNAEFDSTAGTIDYYGAHKYTAQGWTAGGGLEFKPFSGGRMDHVSFKLETNYYDLGRSRIYALQTATPTGGYLLGVKTTGYNTKFGINYSF